MASIVINIFLAFQTDILYLNVYYLVNINYHIYFNILLVVHIFVYFPSTYFLEGRKCTKVITSFSLNKVIVLYCC